MEREQSRAVDDLLARVPKGLVEAMYQSALEHYTEATEQEHLHFSPVAMATLVNAMVQRKLLRGGRDEEN